MAITAAEINAILAEWQTRNTRTYIGMRYVPVFKGVWDGSLEYEPLTIVQSDGSAYVSKSYVPVGVPVTDATFWMPWGDFADGVVTLETLSAEVANAYVRTFDTVADMQAATDLLAGMTCHTNGFHSTGDGGAAYYTVDTSGDITLQGGLYASEVNISLSNAAIDEITNNEIPSSDGLVDQTGLTHFWSNAKRKLLIKSSVAPICFFGRLLDRFGYEDRTMALCGQSVAYDGVYYYSCGSYNSNANQCISKHDATGSLVGSESYTELYHANSLTILGSKIYVATGNGRYIAVVDLASLAYESTITLSEVSIANVFSVSAYNGNLYARCRDDSYNEYIYMVNISTGACTLMCSLGPFENRVNQGFCYAGDVAYFVNNYRSTIFEIDTASGQTIRAYNLPEGDRRYPLGEPEDLFFVDGSLVLCCAEYFVESEEQKASIVYLFKTGIGEVVESSTTEPQPSRHLSLIVNGNATTEFAPYGTFNTIEEACLIANHVHGATLTVSNLSTGYACLVDGKHAINGSGGTQTLSRAMFRNATVNLRTVSIGSMYADNAELNAFVCAVGSIRALYSRLMFSDLTILAGSTFDYRYCDINYRNKIVGASDLVGYTDEASRAYNHVSIETHGDSTYLANLLRALYIRIGITIWLTGHTAGGSITITQYLADSFEINTGESSYPKIGYENGSLYVINSSNVKANLGATETVVIQG